MSVRHLFDLTGRVALITGGSRGLGLQIAEALGEMGATLALSARKADELAEARAHLANQQITASVHPCDIGKPATVDAMVASALEQHGRIDILVNNAGATWGAPLEDYPLEGWQKVVDLNLTGTFVTTQAVGKRAMIPNRSGRIINIASVAGLRASLPDQLSFVAYNASKAGVINLTRAVAAEWGRYHINCNAIAPGFFPSKMTKATLERIGPKVIASTPLGRIGGEEDLKGVAVLLASAASRHITGQVIAVDGGESIV